MSKMTNKWQHFSRASWILLSYIIFLCVVNMKKKNKILNFWNTINVKIIIKCRNIIHIFQFFQQFICLNGKVIPRYVYKKSHTQKTYKNKFTHEIIICAFVIYCLLRYKLEMHYNYTSSWNMKHFQSVFIDLYNNVWRKKIYYYFIYFNEL